MVSHFQFSATCSSPISCLDGAGSMDWHSLLCSTISLTAFIVMFRFTFLTRNKVFAFPKWCMLCRSFRSSPMQHTRAVFFFSFNQAFFTLVRISALFFCNETSMTVTFSPNSLIKSPSAPSRCLINISATPLVLILLSPDTLTLLTWSMMLLLPNLF